MSTLVAILLLAPAVYAGGSLLFGLTCWRPRSMRATAGDALILAAHSDDCVILAGEYGAASSLAGRAVSIVYLTCSDREPGSDLAEARKMEAHSAWSRVGVAEENLHFLDLPNSPMDGPLVSSTEQIEEAQAKIEERIAALPEESVVFLPAAGEQHVDHDLLRKLALKALASVGRPDLRVFEGPEYNRYHSLVRSPGKALVSVWQRLPLLRRLHARLAPPTFAGFVRGGPAIRLIHERDMLDTKREMLGAFTSQGREELEGFFGTHDRLRAIRDPRRALQQEPRFYFRTGSRYLAPSVVCLWILLYEVLFLTARGGGRVIVGLHAPGAVTLGAIVLVSLGLVFASLRRRRAMEEKLVFLAAAAGLASAVV